MQRIYKIEAESEDLARTKLAEELGLPEYELKCLEHLNNRFKFEAITCHPIVEFELSKNKMKAVIRKIKLPIGNEAPALTTDFVVDLLKKKGVRFGIQVETITEALFKVTSDENFNEDKTLNILAAKGKEPVHAQAGRPQWVLDLKLFKKEGVFARKSDLIAKSEISVPGQVGKTIYGEELPFEIEDQFQLSVGKGIQIEKSFDGVFYRTESPGQLFFDQGIRIRLEAKILEEDEGLRAELRVPKASFTGKSFTAKDLQDWAQAGGVVKGLLSEGAIQRQLEKVKKWPARIVVARGRQPVDGKAGQVNFVYSTPEGSRPVDLEKAKLGVIFPGETIAEVEPASEPQNGFTIFGEELRGRTFNEKSIYPGRNVKSEKQDAKERIVATAYGRVKKDQDRIHVDNILLISKDAMLVTLDVFPQRALCSKDILALFRDKDVLFGYNEAALDSSLAEIHKSGKRQPSLVVARGKPVTKGQSAKLRYYFRPDDLKEKGLIVKQTTKDYYAAPGDLLMMKFEPIEAEEGVNVYREKIPVSKAEKASDIKIEAGRSVMEKESGEYRSEENPLCLEYRALTFGELRWEDKKIDLVPRYEISDKEDYVRLWIKARSDFGQNLTYEMIEKFAQEEGVRVELERLEIQKALKTSKLESNKGIWVDIAKSIPAVDGVDAKISYLVKYNDDDIDSLLSRPEAPEPLFVDCVRKKEVLAIKTPAGNGQDGKSVFGRRIVAERGLDLPWQIGSGVARSEDGNQILNELDSAGYVFVEDQRVVVRNTVEISPDRMEAKISIYPSQNPRYQPREDKILGMIQAKGISAGIQIEEIRKAIQEVVSTGEKREVLCAQGQPAEVGRAASHRFAIDLDDHAGQLREDGSVDHKAGGVFQMVKAGQLLMTKQPATRGADGFNVLDEKLSGQMGADSQVFTGEGVRLSTDELEYYATRDGIVEFNGRQLRVIEGLMINGDVDFSTGNVDAGVARVFVRGSVIPGFSVSSREEIIIDKVAEACDLQCDGNITVMGGVIGKEKAQVKALGSVEALYINGGATVTAGKDITASNEILNSRIYAGGHVRCLKDAGKLAGGEIWSYGGIHCKVLGTQGSEQETRVELGVNYLELQQAHKRIEEEGLSQKISEIQGHLDRMDADLKEMYARIPELAKQNQEEAQKLQEAYRNLYEERKEVFEALELAQKQRDVILRAVKRNGRYEVRVEELIHPGVVLKCEDVEWKIKEPLRSVILSWDESSRNFAIRQI